MFIDRNNTELLQKILGNRIKKLRKEKGLTLEALGKATDSCKSYIWEVEYGSIDMSISKLRKIAKALGTDVNTLIA